MEIELATEKDFEEIWRIFSDVISAGDTYVNGASTRKEDGYKKWMNKDAKTFVAKKSGKIIGTYLIKPNQVDRGSHIANASYIVDKNNRGIGVGKALALHSIATAKELGYKAMQFNFVVSSNQSAVNLWKSVGFEIIGTAPCAFNHQDLGYIDTYIMFKKL